MDQAHQASLTHILEEKLPSNQYHIQWSKLSLPDQITKIKYFSGLDEGLTSRYTLEVIKAVPAIIQYFPLEELVAYYIWADEYYSDDLMGLFKDILKLKNLKHDSITSLTKAILEHKIYCPPISPTIYTLYHFHIFFPPQLKSIQELGAFSYLR